MIFNRNHPDLVEAGHSLSSGDLMSSHYRKDTSEAISQWNPFEDSNFNQAVTEEDLFGAEFDKIRQEGKIFCINFKFPYLFFIHLIFCIGTKSLEKLAPENPAIPEDPFQAPFSLRQQRALKKNGSIELEGKLCI